MRLDKQTLSGMTFGKLLSDIQFDILADTETDTIHLSGTLFDKSHQFDKRLDKKAGKQRCNQ